MIKKIFERYFLKGSWKCTFSSVRYLRCISKNGKSVHFVKRNIFFFIKIIEKEKCVCEYIYMLIVLKFEKLHSVFIWYLWIYGWNLKWRYLNFRIPIFISKQFWNNSNMSNMSKNRKVVIAIDVYLRKLRMALTWLTWKEIKKNFILINSSINIDQSCIGFYKLYLIDKQFQLIKVKNTKSAFFFCHKEKSKIKWRNEEMSVYKIYPCIRIRQCT